MLSCLLWNSAVAALMAICLILAGRCFRLTPATRHALWLVVLVKLLSPIGLIWSVPLPFDPPVEMTMLPPEAGQSSDNPLTQDAVYFVALDESDHNAIGVESTVVFADRTPFLPVNQQADAPRSSAVLVALKSISFWLLLLWVAGSLVVAWRYLIQTIRFARFARRGKIAGKWLKRPVEELAQKLGVRMPEVRIVSGLTSPVVWCLFRPVLLWPKGLQNHLKEGGREAVLVHELAHLRRRDHLWRWLELLAAIVHWWNPLFWLARRQMRFQAELACDAWVMGTLPNHRRDYAEALLDVCQRSARPAAPTPAVGVGGEGKKMLERRLSMIMRETVPHRVANGAKLFVVLLAMAALPAWTLGQPKPEPKPGAQPERKATLQFKGGGIEWQIVPDGKTEKKVTEELLKAINFEIEALVVAEGKGKVNPDAKAKEIEAKIKELTAQLEKLKALKAQGEKPKDPNKPAQGIPFKMFFRNAEAKEPKIVIVGEDGKEILKGLRVIVNPAPGPKPEAKQPKPVENKPGGLSFKIENGKIGGQGILIIGEDKKEPSPPKPQVKENPVRIHFDSMKLQGGGNGLFLATPANKSIMLTRTTYKLPKEKAVALETFLKEQVKAKVLETKVEADGLTVTTTPETQKAVESVVNLISGPKPITFNLQFGPAPAQKKP